MKRLLLALVLLATACGGPTRELDLGFKEVPSNVVLGAQSTPTPSVSAIPLVPLPPPPSVVSLPPPPFDLPPPGKPEPPIVLPTAAACPTENPLEAPSVEAPSSIAKPPVPGAYVFDNVGTFAVSGANARRGDFPTRTLRVISDVVTLDDGFSYSVAERIGEVTTTTTYRVVTGALTPAPGNGVFLQKVTYRSGAEEPSFEPLQPVLIAALPLVRGVTSDQRAVDPRSQTAMSFTTTIEGKQRVYACGEPLDSWTVHLTNGRLDSPTQDLDFDATYQLGTQYGGIVIADSVAYRGTDGEDGIQRSNRARISVAPRQP